MLKEYINKFYTGVFIEALVQGNLQAKVHVSHFSFLFAV